MEDSLIVERKKTLSTRTIFIKAKGKLFTDTSIFENYYEGKQIEGACRNGCVNYGKKWSCPPFSHAFPEIEKKYSSACLLCFSTEMKYYTDIKNKYLAVKAANVTLKSLIEKSARDIEKHAGGYSLLSGSCRLCKSCQCKINRPCKHLDKMRYSMEATGLNVKRVCADCLEHDLLWYENKKLPEYTSVVALILYKQHFGLDELSDILDRILSL